MSRREKLLQRIKARPKDFTYDELHALLTGYDCTEMQGKGSRVAFVHESKLILRLHKPHPGNILKLYQIDAILVFLESVGVKDEECDNEKHD